MRDVGESGEAVHPLHLSRSCAISFANGGSVMVDAPARKKVTINTLNGEDEKGRADHSARRL